MSYNIITIEYKCDNCNKKIIIPFNSTYITANNSPDNTCPLGWDWHSPSEYSKNKHYCEDCKNRR